MIIVIMVWLMKKDQSAYIRTHATEAFNFIISMFLHLIIWFFLAAITQHISLIFNIFMVLLIMLPIVWGWCTFKAAMAGFKGQDYRYPFTLRLLK